MLSKTPDEIDASPAPPGAGIPIWDRWPGRYLAKPLILRCTPWIISEGRFQNTHGKIKQELKLFTHHSLTERVLVSPQRFLEDRSRFIRILDTIKWNILHWRAEAERALSQSGLDTVVVRAGLLTDEQGGTELDIALGNRPVTLSTNVARADVARVLLEALNQVQPVRDISVFRKKKEVRDS